MSFNIQYQVSRITLILSGGDRPITIDDILLDEIEEHFESTVSHCAGCSPLVADAPPRKGRYALRIFLFFPFRPLVTSDRLSSPKCVVFRLGPPYKDNLSVCYRTCLTTRSINRLTVSGLSVFELCPAFFIHSNGMLVSRCQALLYLMHEPA